MSNVESILESIEKLTLLEAAELVKAMEAKFDGGNGYIKVGDKYYSIGSITSIREPELQADASANII